MAVKNGGMDVSDARRLRQPEKENTRLKKMVADQALDISILKDVLSKTSEARVMPGSGVQYVQRHIPPPSGWPARPSASIAAQFGVPTHRIGMTTHAGTGRGAAALRRRAAACLVTA